MTDMHAMVRCWALVALTLGFALWAVWSVTPVLAHGSHEHTASGHPIPGHPIPGHPIPEPKSTQTETIQPPGISDVPEGVGASSTPPIRRTSDGLPGGPPTPFPIDIPVAFDLIDQTGERRTEADFAGRAMMIFFGYANCDAICSVALPRMMIAYDRLGPVKAEIAPILITVDPARDTPEGLRASLPRFHESLIGLTGSEEALAAVRERFQVDSKQVAIDHEGRPIFSHGSFIYLIGADGKLLTLLPPILSEDRIAELVRKYL